MFEVKLNWKYEDVYHYREAEKASLENLSRKTTPEPANRSR
jgi:hypothetical protein